MTTEMTLNGQPYVGNPHAWFCLKKLAMVAVAVFAASMSTSAATEQVGNYTWFYHVNGDQAAIYNDNCVAISPDPTGAVVIPSTLGGKKVTSIGQNAFPLGLPPSRRRFRRRLWTPSRVRR